MGVYWREQDYDVSLASDDNETILVYTRVRTRKGGVAWRPEYVRKKTLRQAQERGFKSARSGETRYSDAYRTVYDPPDEVLQQVAREAGIPVEFLHQMDVQERAQYLTQHHDWKMRQRTYARMGYEPDEEEGPPTVPVREDSPLKRFYDTVRKASPETRAAVRAHAQAQVLEQAGVDVPRYVQGERGSLVAKLADAVQQQQVPSAKELGIDDDETFNRMLDSYVQWQRNYEAKEAWNRGHYSQSEGITISFYYPPLTDDIKQRLQTLTQPMEQLTQTRKPDDAYHRARRYANAIGKAFRDRGIPYAVGHIPLGDGGGYLLVGARRDGDQFESITLGALEADGTTLVPHATHPILRNVLSSGDIQAHPTFNTIARFLIENLEAVGAVRLRSHGGQYFIPAHRTGEASHTLRLLAAVAKHAGARMVVTEGISEDDLREIKCPNQATPGRRPPLSTPPMQEYRRQNPPPPQPNTP